MKKQIELNEKNILSWLRDKFKKTVTRVKAGFIRVGYFYSIHYSAKGYEETKTLPYYDKIPLIFVINTFGGYTLGLNINYCPIRVKQKFVKRLKKRNNSQWIEEKPLTNVGWQNIKNEFESVCPEFLIHKYINKRMTKIVRVKFKDIETIAKIDFSDFIGKNLEEVWKEWKECSK